MKQYLSLSNALSGVSAPLVGVACLFAVQFVCFLEGRGLGAVPFPIPGIITGFFLGILGGGFFFSAPFSRGIKSAAALLLTTASVFSWAIAVMQTSHLFSYGACLFGGAVFPPLLKRLLSASDSPGLHLGTALAVGDFFWLFLYLLPEPLVSNNLCGILIALQGFGGLIAALCLWAETDSPETQKKLVPLDRLARESLWYLIAITIVFFLTNSFMDIVFYRMHEATFHIPAQVHLYIWAVYPLTGLFIDKRGADMRLLLACLGGTILSPTLVAMTEGTALYWIIYIVALSCRGAALLYLVLVFAQIGKNSSRLPLIASLPFLGMFSSFMTALLFVESFPGTIYIAFWAFFLTAAFSYISSRIQYALTLAGIIHTTKDETPPLPAQAPDSVAHFSGKYGLSTREQEVLHLIVKGYDTAKLCETLHVSENTIKTHVRQLLRKTETRNRIVLVALFFNEARGREEKAVPDAGHQ